MPEISVIMGVYNQLNKDALHASINSILNQTIKDIEFIIYDDGSCKEAAKLLEEVKNFDERIILIGKEENKGLAFSLNECISKANGTYIARMDADDISLPNRLEIQKKFLDENEEYSWCGTNAELFDEKGVWGKRQMPEKPEKKDYLKYSPYIHPTVMYRRSLFFDVNGYSVNSMTTRCEDYELFMRLRKMGYKGYNIQKYLFQYREDKDSFSRRKMEFRINEMHIRYRNFKNMGILWPVGWLYVLRPVIAGIIPKGVISFIKRCESKYEK